MLTVVTGGARSGKSRFAQSLCPRTGPTGFLATARVLDSEMADRVDRHRQERPSDWTTVEEPVRIARATAGMRGRVPAVLIDCLTLWTTNLLMDAVDAPIDDLRRMAFNELDALIALRADLDLILVTNEVGSGIVPDTALVRKFSDLHGWINQHVARQADRVFLMVCGLPVRIKPAVDDD